MSYLLEVLGRGLIAHLSCAFESLLGIDTDESIEELEASVRVHPNNLDAWVRLGGLRLKADEAVSARRCFLAVLKRDRSHLAARLGMACVFDDLGQSDIALDQLRIAQKIDPTNPALLFCLAYSHEREGSLDEAVRYYQDSLELCPTLRNSHERLAALYLTRGETDLAIHHFRELCELDPQHVENHLTLANLLLKAGDHSGAIERYEHALALEPENWAAHNDLVSAYEEAGLYREAIEHLHKMIDVESDFADTRLRLGDLYARIGDDLSAVAQYRKAVELCPDYLEANVKLGTQHLRACEFAEAARWFSQALEINDRLLSAYVGLGVAQHGAGREEDAHVSFEMARNIEPNSTLLFSEVARMQLKASAGDQSRSYLSADSASRTDPEGDSDTADESAGPVADLLSRQIDRLRAEVKRRPQHADFHYRLGLLLKNRGQVEEAAESFQAAVTINPCYVKALIKLGLALKELDHCEEALAVLQQATELKPEYVDLHYQVGLLFAQRHQFEIAVDHLERAAEGNPQNVDVQANLALALQNMGLVDRANASWQIVQELAPESPQAQTARVQLAKNRKD